MHDSILEQGGLSPLKFKNRHIMLSIILIGVLMANLDVVMLNIALPTITTFFNVSLAQSQWAVTGYVLAMTSLLIVFGKVSDYTGKTKMYLVGFSIFTISSLACGFAGNLNQLIAFRFIQGLGASMIYGVLGALLYQVSPPEERGRAMGYLAAVVAGALLVGPGLGGMITDLLGWKYIFFINVPIGLILLTLAINYLKIPETTSKNVDMDWFGSGTLMLSIVFLLLLCGELVNENKTIKLLIAYGIIFLVSLIAFIFRESKCKKPLLDLSIFSNRKFTMPTISLMLYYIAFNAANFIGPFYFEGVMGYKPLQVGILFMLVPLIMMLSSPVSGWLYDKYHWKYTTGLGMLMVAIACALQGYASQETDLRLIVVAFIIRGIGSGIFQGPNFTEVLNALPMDKTALASSIASTARNLGTALGVSIATILLSIELFIAGYAGEPLSAGPIMLANAIGRILMISGALCALSATASVLRNSELIS